MAKPIKQKCRLCAMLPATKAKSLHGEYGDRCWDSKRCPGRRAYYRKREKSLSQPDDHIQIVAVDSPQTKFAVLYLYRQSESSPIHALAAELWQGQRAIAKIEPIHCFGYTAGQIVQFSQRVLDAFSAQYQIELRQFKDQIAVKPELCPIKPCPLYPEIYE